MAVPVPRDVRDLDSAHPAGRNARTAVLGLDKERPRIFEPLQYVCPRARDQADRRGRPLLVVVRGLQIPQATRPAARKSASAISLLSSTTWLATQFASPGMPSASGVQASKPSSARARSPSAKQCL